MKIKLLQAYLILGGLLSPLAAFANESQHANEHSNNRHAPNIEHLEHTRVNNVPHASVPEVGSIALMATGIFGIYVARRRKI